MTALIEGHHNPFYNGLYTHDSTHEGWPVLKNDKGMYCYRYTPADSWFLNTEFTPDKGACSAGIVAKEGPLPVGARTWQVSPKDVDEDWEEHTLAVTLLRTEAEVTAAEQRIRAAFEAVEASKAALATAQLESKTVSIEGHPTVSYNGLYTHNSTHEGWPVLKNAKGIYCYRFRQANKWMLTDTADFVTGMATANITAREGPLPVGANTWKVSSPEDVDSDWEEHTLTVTLQ